MTSKYETLLQIFVETPVFIAAEARAAGIPSRMLSHFCKTGIIERVSRGVYRGSKAKLEIDFRWEDLALVAMSIPNGVICLVSALCYYGFTDQIMRQYLSKEVALKALQDYLRQTGSERPNLNKLMKYAKTLRVNIHPFIMALTT